MRKAREHVSVELRAASLAHILVCLLAIVFLVTGVAVNAAAREAQAQASQEELVHRVIVGCDNPSALDGYNIISEYDGIYLLGFSDEQKAADAVDNLAPLVNFASLDEEVAIAVEQVDAKDAEDAEDAEASAAIEKEPVQEDETATDSIAELAAAQNTVTAAPSSSIALIDTGAPASSAVASSLSFIGDDVADANGHATEMLASMEEVDSQVKVIALKALDDDGRGSISSIYAAMMYAIQCDVKIINLSLSAYSTSENAALADAVQQARDAGIIVVGAAGNNGIDAKYTVPAGIEDVFAVGACDENGKRAGNSNFGDAVDIFALGKSSSYSCAKTSAWIAANASFENYEERVAGQIGNGLFFGDTPPEPEFDAEDEAPASPEENVPAQENEAAAESAESEPSEFKASWYTVPAGVYIIRSYKSSYYLDCDGVLEDYVNGTKVQLWNEASESFLVSGSGTKKQIYVTQWLTATKKNNLCINLTNGTVANGTAIQLYKNDSTNSCYWYFNQESGQWFTIRSAAGTSYGIDAPSYAKSKDLQLYKYSSSRTNGYWRLQYEVNYNANGGSCSTTTQTRFIGAEASVPTPTRTGYTFAGWYTAASGGTLVAEKGSTADIPSSTSYSCTLYAHWTANKYYVYYKQGTATGGWSTSTYATQTRTYPAATTLRTNSMTKDETNDATYTVTYDYNGSGAANTTAAAYKKRKYTANGWTTTSGSTTRNYANGASYGSSSTDNLTLYPCFSQTTYDSSITAPNPTRAGYAFAGWYTAASGGTKVADGSGSWVPGATRTVYAHWTPNAYTVAFNANGGSGQMGNQSFVYGSAQQLTANSFARAGYKFAGWNSKSGGDGTAYSDCASVSNLTTTAGATVTLFAQWFAGNAVVSGSGNVGETLVASVDNGAEATWQWQRSSNGSTWEDISGATAASYVPSKGEYELYVRARRTNVAGVADSSIYTSAVTIGAHLSVVVPSELDFVSDAIAGELDTPTGAYIENQSLVNVAVAGIGAQRQNGMVLVSAGSGNTPADSVALKVAPGEDTSRSVALLEGSTTPDEDAWTIACSGGRLPLSFEGHCGPFSQVNPMSKTRFATVTWTIEGVK